jgi:hypothetical protein
MVVYHCLKGTNFVTLITTNQLHQAGEEDKVFGEDSEWAY